jgi:tetratricopeptide (TPR) repeat protein
VDPFGKFTLGVFAASIVLSMVAIARLLSRVRQAREGGRGTLSLSEGQPRSFVFNDRKVEAQLHRGRQRSPARLSLRTAAPDGPKLSIRKLIAVDRLARAVGLAPRPDDAARLSAEFLIDSNQQEAIAALERSIGVRSATQVLMSAGATSIDWTKGALELRIPLLKLTAHPDPDATLQEWAEQLDLLARSLPRQITPMTEVTPRWPLRHGLGWLLCVLGPIVGIAALIMTFKDYRPLDALPLATEAMQYWPWAALAGCFAALLLVRGHPSSGRLAAALLPMTLLTTASLMLAAYLLINGEGYFSDEQQTLSYQTLPVTKSIRSGKNHDRYYWEADALQLRDLIGTHHALRKPITYARWKQDAYYGVQLRVGIASGALGHAWIQDVRIIKPGRAADSQAASAPATPSTERTPAIAKPMVAEESPLTLRLQQAKAQYRAKDYTASRQSLDTAIALFEQNPDAASDAEKAEAYWYRASVFANLGEDHDTEREADARAALAIRPDHTGAALLLDGVLVRQQRYDEALALWNDVLTRKPAYSYGRIKRGRIHLALGDAESARADMQAACEAGQQAGCELLGKL